MLKKINKKFLFSIPSILILFVIFLLTLISSYSNTVISDISNNVLRLHVIANSDSEKDQNVKYQVRDILLEYMKEHTQIKTKEEAISFINSNICTLTDLTNQILSKNNCNYVAHISITNSNFPTKTYANTSFPAGNYQALKVELGKASGQNWWCVMFPPLCFVNVSDGILSPESNQAMKENLTDEEYRLISSDETDIQIKFKLVEWINNYKNKKQ